MKYMGSKRAMLQNGLGDLIREKAKSAKRVVDLFCGSAAISWFAAENTECPVLSVDLQTYSAVLARSVISRTKPLDPQRCARDWLQRAAKSEVSSDFWFNAFHLDNAELPIHDLGVQARRLAARIEKPVMRAYGGHYFSPLQCLALDSLREHLPQHEPERSICLAALIAAASRCAAAPGHTAQPLTPSSTSEHSIRQAWRRNPFAIAYKELVDICRRAAQKRGEARVDDAVKIAASLKRDDLVFVDPPYSGVQYSRFYHVLETLAVGKDTSVSGVGRYPPLKDRPQSAFSNKGQSTTAVTTLLEALACAKPIVLFTFPNSKCSNGLSGKIIQEIAQKHFYVQTKTVAGRFSTLGGNNLKRHARLKSEELILTLRPKRLSP